MVARSRQQAEKAARSRCALLPRLAATLALAAALVSLPACGGGGSSEGGGSTSEAVPNKAEAATVKAEATGAAFKLPAKVRVPDMRTPEGPSFIDTSGVDNGWVGAAAVSPARLKFQVNCGEMTYNYDLPSDGTPTLFPVNMGDGDYTFRIMENIEGSSYAELDATASSVSLKSEFDPFLIPNIFCNYDTDSKCVAQARKLTEGVENQGEAVREICTYVADSVTYDYDKAEKLAQSSGYIPNPDDTLRTGDGICFDFASLTAAMLRSVGLPAQVVTGYVSPNDLYHAWVMVYADGTWQTAHFSIKPNRWSRCDVTFASAGSGSTIGDGTTYTDRFIY